MKFQRNLVFQSLKVILKCGHKASHFITLGLCIFLSSGVSAQSITDLKDKKQRLLNEISQTASILDQNSGKKKTVMNHLANLNVKIGQRKNLLETIESEMEYYQDTLVFINEQITTFERHLGGLQKEYTNMSQYFFIQEKINSQANFLLSSSNIKEVFNKLIYLNQYHEIRKGQLINLISTIHDLELINIEYELITKEKEEAHDEQKNQKKLLERELTKEDGYLYNLKGKEKEIKKKLEKKKKLISKLDNEIQLLIEKTITENKAKDKSKIVSLSSNFKSNKGAFGSPVNGAIVVRKYGVQAHPTIKGIKIKNNGVDLMTTDNSPVQPIFSGEVRGIMNVPGYGQVVLISHGEYFSLYGNLKSISVTKGDKVNRKTILGKTDENKDFGHHTLHFELWKGKDKLNPSDWIQFISK